MFARAILSVILLCATGGLLAQRVAVKGRVVHSDSVSPLPFVYVISKASGNGTMTDQNGRFLILAGTNDTLICSFVGYHGVSYPVKELATDQHGEVRIVMKERPEQLAEVRVSAFRIPAYERQYMEDIIDRSRLRPVDVSRSPITALYLQFSKEGRQIKKLARIFEEIITEEQVQKRFNPEILRKLTGDDEINYDAFRRYCFYTDTDYILSSDDITLYTRVMDCYKRWKFEHGVQGK